LSINVCSSSVGSDLGGTISPPLDVPARENATNRIQGFGQRVNP
jgi:hypothetical protein